MFGSQHNCRCGSKCSVCLTVSHAPSPGQVSLQSCSECGERILEGGLLISGQFYHEACFTCTSCGAVLSGTYYTQEVATCLRPLA